MAEIVTVGTVLKVTSEVIVSVTGTLSVLVSVIMSVVVVAGVKTVSTEVAVCVKVVDKNVVLMV